MTQFYQKKILFLPIGNRVLKDDKIVSENKEEVSYETILNDNKYNQDIKSLSLKDVSFNDFDKLDLDIKQSIAKSFLEEQGLLKQAPKNKEEVQDLQRELKGLGFDLGTYGKNKDGVDGLYGKKTKNALDLYNKNILESSYDLVKEGLKVKERESFINTKPENKDFFYLQNDDQIRDYQKVYSDKGYLKNKIEDFNFNFTAKDLKTDYKKFNTEFNKVYEKDESCYGEECASFVTLDILNNLKSFYGEEEGTKKFNESQVRGDAWTMNSTITKAGGSTTYNVFSEGKPKGIKNVKKYVESKIENAPKLDKSKVKVGDIVHMYYEKSGNFDKAYKEGDNIFSTHVGLIKEDKNGNLVVEHNVHGKVMHNKLDDFINKTYTKAGSSKVAITGLTSPKYNRQEKKEEEVSYKVSSSPNQFDMNFISNKNSPFFKENLPLAQESLAVNKDKILKDIPITSTEYDNLEKAVLSIMWKESYANEMVDNPSLRDNPTSYLKKTAAPLREKILGIEASKGLTQIKDKKNFTEDVQKNLIKDEKDLYDPKKSSVISLYSLSSKYLYLRDLSKKEGIPITQDELTKLSMLSWNEDISVVGKSLSKYKDFDTVWEAYNTSKKTGEKETHPYSKALSLYDNAFKKRISSK
jgi:hypothetical protein